MRLASAMIFGSRINQIKNNILLIPGPITTSKQVQHSMTKDIASRQHKFVDTIASVRKYLLDISNASSKNYSCILFQGSGTYANEAVIGSFPNTSKFLSFSNGIYGQRLFDIADTLNIDSKIINCNPLEKITIKDVQKNLSDETHVSLVHHETSNGIVNDIEGISKYLKEKNKIVMVDGISSLGGIPINIEELDIDYFVGSSNKCLHAFPGISFIIAKKKTLELSKTRRSLSLDLYGQYKDFEKNGQFRYTPPPQIVESLNTSIKELIEQGGVPIRYESYLKKNKILREGLENMGLTSYISKENQGPIMVLFRYPWKGFDFYELYLRLLKKNIVIYSAQIMSEEVFRLGNIGEITEEELIYCVDCIKFEINEMKSEITNKAMIIGKY